MACDGQVTVPASGCSVHTFCPRGCSGCPSGRRTGPPGTGRARPRRWSAACAGAVRCCWRRRPRRSGSRSRSSRSRIGAGCRSGSALVTSSLRISSVVNASSSSPHSASWPGDRGADRGDGGRVRAAPPTRRPGPAASARVRATSRATSSVGRGRAAARRAPPGRCPRASGRRGQSAARSRSRPTSMSPSRSSTSPSVYRHQPAALGQLELGRLERQPAQAQRRAGGQVGEVDACRPGPDHGGRRVAGAGHGAAPGRPGRRSRTGRWRR